MEVSNSALRAELGICLKGMREALAAFTQHIQSEARDAWIWRRPDGRADAMAPLPPDISREHTLELIAEALNDIKYTDDQDAHESRLAHLIEIRCRRRIEGQGRGVEVSRLRRLRPRDSEPQTEQKRHARAYQRCETVHCWSPLAFSTPAMPADRGFPARGITYILSPFGLHCNLRS